MSFGERLRELRKNSGISQEELAERIGVSRRSLIYYEQGKSYPSRPEVITAIADVFGVTTDSLYGESDRFVSMAAAGGTRARQSAQEVIDNMCALFAGGELSSEDKEEALHIVMEAYMRSREKNRKFAPKSRGGESDD